MTTAETTDAGTVETIDAATEETTDMLDGLMTENEIATVTGISFPPETATAATTTACLVRTGRERGNGRESGRLCATVVREIAMGVA